ncbi:AAA family ATPase [Succinimonas sp.]|uniref:AAA family ATPase n=1 Tax=Succinimonas sp. TaxID=1936151 RepID=UPI00386B47B8
MQAREDLAIKPPAVSKKPESSNTIGSRDGAPLDADNVRLAERIRLIMDAVSAGLIDRDYVVKLAVLAVLAGQNIFLYGPPGTAKSMLSRRLAAIVRDGRYFEHLMHRFCTPEEIFGPVSLSELKKDNYERKTAGYLPEADFAFLDEIWKSSPAVLNTLLTIINEHSFHNGSKVLTVPLRSLAVASNEIPDAESGMEALYDRFPVRIPVFPVKGEDAFRHLLEQRGAGSSEDFQGISREEYEDWLRQIRRVPLSDNVIAVLSLIREEVLKVSGTALSVADHDLGDGEDPGVSPHEPRFSYVSDRRWMQAAELLRAAAFFNGHEKVYVSSLPLAVNALWNIPGEITAFRSLVYDSIRAVVSKDIRSGSSGRFLDTGREIGELMSLYADPDSFKSSGIQVKLTPEREVWFRFLKDTGLCYRALDRMWHNEVVMEDFSLKSIWAPGIRKQVKNPAENGRSGFVPIVGDVIRIIVTRDINGYLGSIDLPGLECFRFTVPGMLGSNGVLTEDNHFTCQAGVLPKLMQIYLKNCLEPEVELYARISGLPQHPSSLDGKLIVTVRINFEGIFAERFLRKDIPFCDTDKMTEIKPLSVGIDGKSLYGEFFHQQGFRLYSAQMENHDSVIVAIEDKTPLPARGEVCEYWNRFMGRGFELCEVNSYRRWFKSMVKEFNLAEAREISCRIMPDGRGGLILTHRGLCCISDELSRIHHHEELADMVNSVVAMRLQGIDDKRCLLMVSSLKGLDITGIWLNYEGLFSMRPSERRDENFAKTPGTAELAKKDNGDYLVALVNAEGVTESEAALNAQTYEVLTKFNDDISRLSEKMSLNQNLVDAVSRDLEKREELVNSDIFLSEADKYDLTRLLVEVYEPYFQECSVSTTYETQLKELLTRYEKITIPKIDMKLREEVRKEAERIAAERKAAEEKARKRQEEEKAREKAAEEAAKLLEKSQPSGKPELSQADFSLDKTGPQDKPRTAPAGAAQPETPAPQTSTATQRVVAEVVAGAVSGGIAGTLVRASSEDNKSDLKASAPAAGAAPAPAEKPKPELTIPRDNTEQYKGPVFAKTIPGSLPDSAAGKAPETAPEKISEKIAGGVGKTFRAAEAIASKKAPEQKPAPEAVTARSEKPVLHQAKKSWSFKNLFGKGSKNGAPAPEAAAPEPPPAPAPAPAKPLPENRTPDRDPMRIDEAAIRELEESDEFKYRFEPTPKAKESEVKPDAPAAPGSANGNVNGKPAAAAPAAAPAPNPAPLQDAGGKPVIGAAPGAAAAAPVKPVIDAGPAASVSAPPAAPGAAPGSAPSPSPVTSDDAGKPVLSGVPGGGNAAKPSISMIPENPAPAAPEQKLDAVSPAGLARELDRLQGTQPEKMPEKKPDPVSLSGASALPAGLIKKLQEKKAQKEQDAPAPEPLREMPLSGAPGSLGSPAATVSAAIPAAPAMAVSSTAHAAAAMPTSSAMPDPRADNAPVLSGSAPAPEPEVSSVVQTDVDFTCGVELSGPEDMSYEERARMERFQRAREAASEESKPKRIDIRELLKNHHSNLL